MNDTAIKMSYWQQLAYDLRDALDDARIDVELLNNKMYANPELAQARKKVEELERFIADGLANPINQDAYIKVLENEIKVKDAQLRKYADHSGISSVLIDTVQNKDRHVE